jgi:cob(I)alamin adenosyltransferase
MGERHSKKIYTRMGDEGKTGLLKGGRVPKYYLRIEINGLIDELNSWIGYVRAINRDPVAEEMLGRLQPRLNILCSDIAAPKNGNDSDKGIPRIQTKWKTELEGEIDRMETDLSVLTRAVLPGGQPTGASLHIARTICRRTELLMVLLQDEEGNVNPDALRFINRLSDYLFMLAQWTNYRSLKGEYDNTPVMI